MTDLDDLEKEWGDKDKTAAALARIEAVIYSYQAPQDLTQMEKKVLTCFSYGLRYSEAAEVLGCGLETVKTHVRLINRKLAAKNTTHACCIALRQGWIK